LLASASPIALTIFKTPKRRKGFSDCFYSAEGGERKKRIQKNEEKVN